MPRPAVSTTTPTCVIPGLEGYVEERRRLKGEPSQRKSICPVPCVPDCPIRQPRLRVLSLPRSTSPISRGQSFRPYVDFDMPQVYWLLAHNPVTQLQESYRQFQKRSTKVAIHSHGCGMEAIGLGSNATQIALF